MSAAVFAARGVREPEVSTLERASARSACRVFRGTDGFEVAIPEHIVERGLAFCRRARPLEWFAVIVGTQHRDERGTHVLVRGLVLDPDAEATTTSVRSTVASAAEVRRRAALFYPDAIVLGWAHGHPPGAGAFFSATDRDNQETWTEPNALGLVFEAEDPKQLAVFRGPDSERLDPVRCEPKETSPTVEARASDPIEQSLLVSKLIDEVVEKRTRDTVTGAAFMSWITLIAAGTMLFHYVHDHVLGAQEAEHAARVEDVREASATSATTLPVLQAPTSASGAGLQCIVGEDVAPAPPEAFMSEPATDGGSQEESHVDHHAARDRAARRRSRRRSP